jgi:hypothetical protein
VALCWKELDGSSPGVKNRGKLGIQRECDLLSSRCSVFTSSATDIQTITQGYLDFLDSLDITATYVVDKMPHNFEKLGLIALCFPQATILHVERDPVDTCLSCYFQNFSNDRHGYSDDLADLGRHYLY